MIVVLITHLIQVISNIGLGERNVFGIDTVSLGQFGVLVFFVHTALVLMQSMERSRLNGPPLFLNFYLRRAFRIYPLAVCTILVCVAVRIPTHAQLDNLYHWPGYRGLVSNLLLIQNLTYTDSVSGPLWSLPYEVQMYLVLPALFLFVRPGKSALNFVWIYLAGAVLSWWWEVAQYVPCFLAGLIGYRLLSRIRPLLPGMLWLPWLAIVWAGYASIDHARENRYATYGACLVVGLSIPLFQKCRGAGAAAAAQVAKYSYGIYLCHVPLLWFWFRQVEVTTAVALSCFAITLALAAVIVHHLIEQPMIGFGVRLANGVAPSRPLAKPAAAA